MRKLQIGIMGSAADLNYKNKVVKFAKKIGKLIAQSNNILVYGAEIEYSSLSTEAAKECTKYGGVTVGIAPSKNRKIYGDYRPDVLISSGMEMGGGRELALVLSCDVIIAIAGGSGTLTEMAIAYQRGIPIITISKFGGWSEKLSDSYFDDRKRLKCITATTEEEAVEIAIEEGEKYYENNER